VLADIDPDSFNLDPDDVKRRLTKHTRAIIVPHMFGQPAEMDALLALGLPIIEDCAQAVGGRYHGRNVGTLGHAAIFSFYATKMMTTGEGGMVASDSRQLIERIRDLREYDEKEDYRPRFNYKMTDVQAAIGLAQLERLGDFISSRRAIAQEYDQALDSEHWRLPAKCPGHIYFRYVLKLDTGIAAMRQFLKAKGIGCARPVYRPLHHYLKLAGYPRADAAWRQSLSLPIYPSLKTKEVDRIIAAVIATRGQFA